MLARNNFCSFHVKIKRFCLEVRSMQKKLFLRYSKYAIFVSRQLKFLYRPNRQLRQTKTSQLLYAIVSGREKILYRYK